MHRVRPFADPARSRGRRLLRGGARLRPRRERARTRSTRCSTIMGPRPAQLRARRSTRPRAHPELRAMVHRWTRGEDIAALLWILRQMLERSGSIEAFFLDGDAAATPDVGAALDSFSTRALALDIRRAYGRVPKRPGVCYFFPRPSAGSACKRLNLFLRWMVRRDEVDLGVWTRVSPARLIVPLDTHVIRLGRCLRLTRYVSPGWKMAADITASLRKLDPGRSRALRFFDLPRRHDERLRLRPQAGRLAMSAQRAVPSTAAPRATVRADRGAAPRHRARRGGCAPRDRADDRCVARGASTAPALLAGQVARRRRRSRRRAPTASARSCGSARPEDASTRRRVAHATARAARSRGRPTASASAFLIDGSEMAIYDAQTPSSPEPSAADAGSRADPPRARHHLLGERPRRDVRRLSAHALGVSRGRRGSAAVSAASSERQARSSPDLRSSTEASMLLSPSLSSYVSTCGCSATRW